jgi:hypothetical protein
MAGMNYDKYAGRGVNLNGICAATARVCIMTGPHSHGYRAIGGLFPGGPGPPPSLLFIGYLDLVPGLKRQGREAERFLLVSRLMYAAITPFPIHLHGAALN